MMIMLNLYLLLFAFWVSCANFELYLVCQKFIHFAGYVASNSIDFSATVMIVAWHSLVCFPSAASELVVGGFVALDVNLVIDVSQVVWTRGGIYLLLFCQAMLEL